MGIPPNRLMREMPSEWFTLCCAYLELDPFGSEAAKHTTGIAGLMGFVNESPRPRPEYIDDPTPEQIQQHRNRLLKRMEQAVGLKGSFSQYGWK